MRLLAALLAAAAAAAVAGVGLARGTYAAGGSDSSCYALMAEAFAGGTRGPSSELALTAPWPEAQRTFTPGGFVPSQRDPAASAPVCAPGFSLLLAPLVAAGGRDAIFLATPAAGAALVWLTYAAARAMAGPWAGAVAAVVTAASPPLLYQVVQPMNDVATAAFWMAAFAALVSHRWALAGLSCGLALLVRPNLLPLAAVAGLFVLADRRGRPRGAVTFAIAALPFGAAVLVLNDLLYGSPFRTGYGALEHLFGARSMAINAPRYLGWLVETHTLFPLVGLAAPFVLPRERRRDAWLALGLALVTCLVYFLYTPFDDWSYLRFLLPAITLLLALASAVFVSLLTYAPPIGRAVVAGAAAVALAVTGLRTAEDRLAFDLTHLEQRYRSGGLAVRDRLPERAVVLSSWGSGAVRFHGRREALDWMALDEAWLDRSLAWLDERGHPPYILLESWEEPGFRTRFGPRSAVGRLDWPPRFEIDRVVRIYDPRDRVRYDRGEDVQTEYLWPLR